MFNGFGPIASAPLADSGYTRVPFTYDAVFDYGIAVSFDYDVAFTFGILGGPLTYTASAVRTVRVQPGTRAFTASGDFWDMSNPKKPRGLKDPNSTIDISIDWSDWLADCQDAAVSYTWTLDGGLTQAGAGTLGNVSTVFVSAGTSGAVANLTCRITTASTPPRSEDRTVQLTIEDR
jgi:hypothetical protein